MNVLRSILTWFSGAPEPEAPRPVSLRQIEILRPACARCGEAFANGGWVVTHSDGTSAHLTCPRDAEDGPVTMTVEEVLAPPSADASLVDRKA